MPLGQPWLSKPIKKPMKDTKIKPDWVEKVAEIFGEFPVEMLPKYIAIVKLFQKQEEQHKMEIIGEAAKLATKDIKKLKQQHESELKKQQEDNLRWHEETMQGIVKQLKQQHRADLEKSKLEGFRWGVNYLSTLINESTLISELFGWKDIVDYCVEKAHKLTKTNIPDHVKDKLINSQKGK